MSTTRLSFSIVLLFLCLQVNAQENRPWGLSGYFQNGLMFSDMDPINDVTQLADFQDLSSTNLAIGGGLRFYYNRLVFGLDGGYLGQESVDSPEYTLRYVGGFGNFSFGYNVLKPGRFLLYPNIGAGYIGTLLDLSPRNQGATFEDIFTDTPANQNDPATIGGANSVFQIAVDGDWFLGGDDAAAYGLMLGFSLGYRFGPDIEFKNRAGNTLLEQPGFQPGGFFLGLRLGGGYYGRY